LGEAARREEEPGGLNALRFFVLVGCLFTLVAIRAFLSRKPHYWYYMVPPLSWSIHVGVFYTLFLLSTRLPAFARINYQLWVVIILLQATFMVLGVTILMAYDRSAFKRR
jgi:hypothetical protein